MNDPSLAGPNSPRSPQVGDYVVISHSWSYELAGPLSRVTAQKVFWPSSYRDGDRQSFKDCVLFSGPLDVATLLSERLTSSRALRDDEKRKADIRHQERTQAAVAKAAEAARASGTRVAPQVTGEGSREEP